MKSNCIALLLSVISGNFAQNNSYDINFLNNFELGRRVQSFLELEAPDSVKEIADLEANGPAIQLKTPRKLRNGVTVYNLKRNFVNAMVGYCSIDNIGLIDCICDRTFHDIDIDENEAIDSVVVVAANVKLQKLVVSYRPTFTLVNWLENFDFISVQLPGAPTGVKVHQGFYLYYSSIAKKSQEAMGRLLDNPKYENYTIQATGYSLGGAIASLSIPDWVKFLKYREENRRLESINLAGPRVGNQAFANYVAGLNATAIRYANHNDVVNHLPPRAFGYVHVGTEFYDHKVDSLTSKIDICSEYYDEDPKCSLGIKEPYSAIRHAFPFDNLVPFPPVCST